VFSSGGSGPPIARCRTFPEALQRFWRNDIANKDFYRAQLRILLIAKRFDKGHNADACYSTFQRNRV
jgi:hypothetical protein